MWVRSTHDGSKGLWLKAVGQKQRKDGRSGERESRKCWKCQWELVLNEERGRRLLQVSEQHKDPGLRKPWLTMTEAPMDLEMGKAKMTF